MTSPAPIALPPDVIGYVFDIFETASDKVADRLGRMPTLHEESLDLALIDALSEARGPHILPSGVTVDLDVHFVGGGRHYKTWEVADLGVIVNFRRGGELLRTKVVLFQSKRLYPREVDFVEDVGLAKPGGFGWLMSPSVAAASQPRTFRFDKTCRYRALKVEDDQWQAIAEYQATFRLPVYYLLYHPRRLPVESNLPATPPPKRSRSRATSSVGARVIPAPTVRARASSHASHAAPSYEDLRDPESRRVGERLPEFMANEVLGCREGYVVDPAGVDPGLSRIFNQRSGPIAAAIRLEINLGDEEDGSRSPLHVL